MPHTIKLTRSDQMLLLNLLADSFDYKVNKKLKSQESIQQMSEYYISAAEKIRDNYIEVRHPKNNFFTWFADNLSHSGREIWMSAECQQAMEICQAASKNIYDSYVLRRASNRLIEVTDHEKK